MGESRMHRVVTIGLYGAVCAMPVSFLLIALHANARLAQIKASLFDAILWAVFIVWIWDAIRRRRLSDIALPPPAIMAFVAASACSALLAGGTLSSAKELIQVVGCFAIFPILVIDCMTTRARIERALLCLYAVAAAVVIYGAAQYVVLAPKTHLVRSFFDNRNVLSGFLAMIVPLCFAAGGERHARSMKWVRVVVVVGGAAVMTALFPFIALFGALIVVSRLKYRGWRPAAAFVALFILCIVSPISVPLGDVWNIKRQFVEPRSLSEYHASVRRSAEMTYSGVVGSISLSRYVVVVATSMSTPRTIPAAYADDMANARKKDDAHAGREHVAQRFIEWRAAIDILGDRPALGVGLGNYQAEIGRFYSPLPKLNTMEPDTQNGYCVTLFTAGLVGLGSLVWMLRHSFRRLRELMKISSGDAFVRDLGAGLFGSLLGFTAVNFFVPVLHQSTAVLFAIIVSLAASAERHCAPR